MPELESLFNKAAGLEACNVIKKRLQLWCFPLNIAKFLRTPILKNICERLLLRVPKPTSCLFLYPLETSKNESLRYFQWVYKEINGVEWGHTPLYKNESIFVCVSVNQALTSNEKDIKNLRLQNVLVLQQCSYYLIKKKVLMIRWIVSSIVSKQVLRRRHSMSSDNGIS